MYFFLSSVVDPPMLIYMGKDKYENEELLKYGFPEDVWFHVDKLSSAHVYLRLPKGMSTDDIPKDVLVDCAQLVKANSIEGCKLSNVSVVYTPFPNLKKTQGMDVGQVGFHSSKQVRTIMVEKKMGEIVNRLNHTREEKFPDLRADLEKRDAEERRELRRKQEEERQLEAEQRQQMKVEEEAKTYKSIMVEDNMRSNQFDDDVDYKAVEDDFM